MLTIAKKTPSVGFSATFKARNIGKVLRYKTIFDIFLFTSVTFHFHLFIFGPADMGFEKTTSNQIFE